VNRACTWAPSDPMCWRWRCTGRWCLSGTCAAMAVASGWRVRAESRKSDSISFWDMVMRVCIGLLRRFPPTGQVTAPRLAARFQYFAATRLSGSNWRGFGLPAHSIRFSSQFPSTRLYRLWQFLLQLQCFVTLVYRVAYLQHAGMHVATSRVRLFVAQHIHQGHQISRSLVTSVAKR